MSSQGLARGALILLSFLLLTYTWMLYKGVSKMSADAGGGGGGRYEEAAARVGSGRSGEGSPVRCFHLQLEAPLDGDEREVSFRVREDNAGLSLRAALDSGAARYCAANGVVYRAEVVPRDRVGDSRFDVLLGSPTGRGEPSDFPAGPPADSGYVLEAPEPEADGGPGVVSTYMVFF